MTPARDQTLSLGKTTNAASDAASPGKPLSPAELTQLKNAYGMEEIEAERSHLFGSFHLMA